MLDVGCWTFWHKPWTIGRLTLDVKRWMSDVGRDVARWMFDSARCTLHVVRSYVGRCRLDVKQWLFGC